MKNKSLRILIQIIKNSEKGTYGCPPLLDDDLRCGDCPINKECSKGIIDGKNELIVALAKKKIKEML